MRSKDMLCMGLVNDSEQKKDGGHFCANFTHTLGRSNWSSPQH